ncbi:hypothetical protein UFOVP1_35 [uncultured Caudovirales phage]|uniref:Uncharacterized protein n=1 Tax=uncultured Caudovirales phage TaxID=2100421 RepID=A0A6J5KHE3_9CAUD|nr:hypothetical protein UFOVP1_35 [uncultured Caudovirales phage]
MYFIRERIVRLFMQWFVYEDPNKKDRTPWLSIMCYCGIISFILWSVYK